MCSGCSLDIVLYADEEKREIKKMNGSILLKASNDKRSQVKRQDFSLFLLMEQFKQSSSFRIHLAIKIAFQVIICKETDSIKIFPCSEFVFREIFTCV